MKNKKLKYILIPLVIIIWGLVIYKIFSYQDNNYNELLTPVNKEIKKNNILKKDSFNLIIDYKDPFLKNTRFVKQKSTTNQHNINNETKLIAQIRKNKNRQRRKSIKPTNIEFGGIVVNGKTGKTTALVKIEGKNYLLNKNSKIKNITINYIYADSIIISDGNIERTVLKK